MLPDRARYYVLHGIAATPKVYTRLVTGISDEVADRRPDPERFTIREALAHVADWEGVWMERIGRIVHEDNPFLPGYDEGQWAIDHDYAHSVISEQLDKFVTGRADLLAFLNSLTPEQWLREGVHGELGPISVETLIILMLGHDGYHSEQFVDFCAA